MPRSDRNQLLERFREMIARKEPIIGAGAGSRERLPVEIALTEQVRAFKKIAFPVSS